MRTSQQMVDLIKTFEGFRAKAYKCPAGVWTIGYGTTKINGKSVPQGMVIGKQEAETYLRKDLEAYEKEVNTLPNIGAITQNQFDAMVCFCYNCGTGSFHRSVLRKLIIANPYNPAISKEFYKWRYATVNGVKTELSGLAKRRATEGAWYFYGPTWSNHIKDVKEWARS